jgi:hypothetical protein
VAQRHIVFRHKRGADSGMGARLDSGKGLSATAKFDRNRSTLASWRGERVLTHNRIVGGGTILAGLLGVAFQTHASHQLRPSDDSAVFAIALVSFSGLSASASTLLTVRKTSRRDASSLRAPSAALLTNANRWPMLGRLGPAASAALGSAPIPRSSSAPFRLLIAGSARPLFGLAPRGERFAVFAAVPTGQAG